jgi:hypothetical protein
MTPDLARDLNRAHDVAPHSMGRWYTTLPEPDPIARSDAGEPNSPTATRVDNADLIESDWA